ncbi:NADH-quinone oxidoreductase subunit NuoK [Buchnera aphidicola]|uniref:NADH-quinone oxidoreductase subunit NuoK n=1 Tax=Buchnera aphidicola TaxID=9 RepID=UPI0030EB17E6
MILFFHGLIFSMILFFLGISCLLFNRNFLFILIGLEIMINSLAMAIVIISNYYKNIDGQIMYIFLITIAAAEAGIGLIFLVNLFKKKNTLNIEF